MGAFAAFVTDAITGMVGLGVVSWFSHKNRQCLFLEIITQAAGNSKPGKRGKLAKQFFFYAKGLNCLQGEHVKLQRFDYDSHAMALR